MLWSGGKEEVKTEVQEGNVRGKNWVAFTKERLEAIGLEPERLEFFHVAASKAGDWVDAVQEMTSRAIRLGPSPFNPKSGTCAKPAVKTESNKKHQETP